MFIFTAKLNRRIIALAILVVAVAASAVLLISAGGSKEVEAVDSAQAPAAAVSSRVKIETNDDRVNFLTSYGWEVESKPLEFMEVRIPDEFNESFTEYNDLQKSQGYDLSKFKGKRVIRYTYKVINYPTGETDVVANILVYKNKIIGGDICSARLDGFMHGFEMPTATTLPAPTLADTTASAGNELTVAPDAGDVLPVEEAAGEAPDIIEATDAPKA